MSNLYGVQHLEEYSHEADQVIVEPGERSDVSPLLQSIAAVTPDLTKPSLCGLVYLLRNKAVWKHKMRWDYRQMLTEYDGSLSRRDMIARASVANCGTRGCAMGLSAIMWPEPFLDAMDRLTDVHAVMAEQFDIEYYQSREFFATVGVRRGKAQRYVTEVEVADDIEDYLVAHPEKCTCGGDHRRRHAVDALR